MKKSTLNIIYLYNSLEEAILKFHNELHNYPGGWDEYFLNITTDYEWFKHSIEVFNIEIVEKDKADRYSMYPLSEVKINDVDCDTGNVCPDVESIVNIIDDWFEKNGK